MNNFCSMYPKWSLIGEPENLHQPADIVLLVEKIFTGAQAIPPLWKGNVIAGAWTIQLLGEVVMMMDRASFVTKTFDITGYAFKKPRKTGGYHQYSRWPFRDWTSPAVPEFHAKCTALSLWTAFHNNFLHGMSSLKIDYLPPMAYKQPFISARPKLDRALRIWGMIFHWLLAGSYRSTYVVAAMEPSSGKGSIFISAYYLSLHFPQYQPKVAVRQTVCLSVRSSTTDAITFDPVPILAHSWWDGKPCSWSFGLIYGRLISERDTKKDSAIFRIKFLYIQLLCRVEKWGKFIHLNLFNSNKFLFSERCDCAYCRYIWTTVYVYMCSSESSSDMLQECDQYCYSATLQSRKSLLT